MKEIKKKLARILRDLDDVTTRLEGAGFPVNDLDESADRIEGIADGLAEL
jgi:hypothetical protein